MRTKRSLALLLGVLVVLLGAAFGSPALALSSARVAQPTRVAARTAPVIWTEVTIALRDKHPELEHFLKQVIGRQTRLADWGKRRQSPLEARFEVTELSTVLDRDVVHVTCTAVGKLKGGPLVRSHFSMGGRPSRRADLERQLLTLLSRGIVGRLAEIARAGRAGS